MIDDCEIENRIDDRRRALRILGRAIDELELAGCDDILKRLEAARADLIEMTPDNRKRRVQQKSMVQVEREPELGSKLAIAWHLRGLGTGC